jgi:hypothetical protein
LLQRGLPLFGFQGGQHQAEHGVAAAREGTPFVPFAFIDQATRGVWLLGRRLAQAR